MIHSLQPSQPHPERGDRLSAAAPRCLPPVGRTCRLCAGWRNTTFVR